MHRELTGPALPSTRAALALVGLPPLMALTAGDAGVGIGLVDGPVADHPDLVSARLHALGPLDAACTAPPTDACAHGTFVAGILAARRGATAPAICPGCTVLVRAIFGGDPDGPSATPAELAAAIVDCLQAGARIVNLSVATGQPTTRAEPALRHALDYAARRGALVVAAVGNQAELGSSELTRHPGVIPVVGYDRAGRPLGASNFGRSAALRGLGAPGESIVSLGAGGRPPVRSGTSFAAPFVTGALALLWSLFPDADAGRLRGALVRRTRRTSVIPPLMDAQAAYRRLAARAAPAPA